MEIFIVTAGLLTLCVGLVALYLAYQRGQKIQQESTQIRSETERLRRNIEAERKDALIRLKDELYKKRVESEAEIKRERAELERFQSKLNGRFETIEKKETRLDDLQRELQAKERTFIAQTDVVRLQEQRYRQLIQDYSTRLEVVSGLSRDEARASLMATIEADVRMSQEKYIQKIEEEARGVAKERAVSIVVNAMQRYTADQVSDHSSGVVHLPNDEMKGRIIGKEGRNIKSLEMATGMEFVIGDTPEIITISGFNPIRREVAKRSLEKLIADGRINPTRIEETVESCEREIEELIEEYGKKTIVDFNLQGVKPELISLLGKLHFRTSFSQNVLVHSVEVGLFARMIAEELGLKQPDIALRGGLLHDIGKALSAECEGPHALIGADIARTLR